MKISSSSFLAGQVLENSDFSIDNIPFGVGYRSSKEYFDSYRPRCMTAIGSNTVDLSILQDAGAFDDIYGLDSNVFSESSLNGFMEHSPTIWSRVRKRLQDLFTGKIDLLESNQVLQSAVLQDMSTVHMVLPVRIGDYTDFYSSREHATNVGTMFRSQDNALNPNWLHLPVAYHGRASTVFCSGQPIVRPHGQLQKDPTDSSEGSVYGPSKQLDFELEVAFFVGNAKDNKMLTGCPLTIQQAKDQIFGFVLMNDWSARDIQKWEYVPLGPFTSKNFATTISPWIVTTEALQAFQSATSAGTQDNPIPLAYLQDPEYSSYDIQLSVAIQSESMAEPFVLCWSNFKNLYWNAAQQLVHHSVSGCLMKTGDLLGSGTISGLPQDSFGSMLELSWKGSRAVGLSKEGDGETRTFLNDGDTIIMSGTCQKNAHGRVGFGKCLGKVLPAGSKVPVMDSSNYGGKDDGAFGDIELRHDPASSRSRAVEIALSAKRLSYKSVVVAMDRPTLLMSHGYTGETHSVSGALAIIKFLDQKFPASRALFPIDTYQQIQALQMIEIIIESQTQRGNASQRSFEELEARVQQRKLAGFGGPYAMGGFSPTIVECFLLPQIHDAQKQNVDVEKEFPSLYTIFLLCMKHPCFKNPQCH